MALPIYYSSVNPIANAWFSQKERTMATAILGLAVPIGAALGLLLPLIFMAGENELTPPAEVQKSFHKMNFYQNIYLTVSTLLLLDEYDDDGNYIGNNPKYMDKDDFESEEE